MQILVLLAFVVAHVEVVVDESAGPGQLAVAMAGYWLGLVLLGGFDLLCSRKALADEHAAVTAAFRRHHVVSTVTRIWLLGGMAGLLAIGYRRSCLEGLGVGQMQLLEVLVALLPFLVGLVITWLLDYPFHRILRRRLAETLKETGEAEFPCWSRLEYVTFSLRHHVLFIAVPICLIILGVDILKLCVFPLLGESEAAKWAATGMILCVVGGVFLIAPLLVAKVWKTRPLPDGPTRQSLEEMCRRMGVRYRNILVWVSGGVLANAGAMGLISPVRYLLLSDALLSNSSPEHIRAIFAHEAAHIRQHHIFYSAMFAVSSMLLCSAAAWGLISLCGLSSWTVVPPVVAEAILMMALLAGAWVWGFGFISKCFERQSDVIGAWASGPGRPPRDAADTSIDPVGAEQFAGALERVARLSGIPLRQRNWRHGRMADRITYIRSLGDAGSRKPIDNLIRRIKILLWAGLILGVALTIWENLARPAV